MNNTKNKICLTKRPIYAVAGFIISFIIACIFLVICIFVRYKFIDFSSFMWMIFSSLLFCICFELIFVFNFLGKEIIIDFNKERIIRKKLLFGFSFKLHKIDLTNIAIIENKKGKKFLVINNVKYTSKFFNPFILKYNEKNEEMINMFLGKIHSH